ncbi:MAG TPA: ABC-ATPase UvrA, partial [Patescibacteria group bacterium]|nr:ABC-ATPase UvrA [Patescibacteria group bacterium]
MDNIIIKGAKEGNLKDITLEIPRNKFVVFAGLSGSGKSTLAIDTIFQECQRQYLEAMGLQGIRKPKIDSIRNVSPSLLITQNEYSKNPRSSVGTVTDIYTDLRMIYEKLSNRICPKCNREIISSQCREEVEKSKDNFIVYMFCSQCKQKMEKLTRTHFSYNTRQGACKTCQGLGKVLKVNENNVVHQHLSLEAGAIDFWEHKYKDYQISVLNNAFKHYNMTLAPDTPVIDFNEGQKAILLYGVESDEVKNNFPGIVPPKAVAEGRFEGLFPVLWRKLSEKGGSSESLDAYFDSETCPDCSGERLNELSRSVTVRNTRLPELVSLSLEELYQWLIRLEDSVSSIDKLMVEPYLLDLKTKIQRILNVGLGYLSLDRQTMTLSGGEAQRIKLAATLDSSLTGIIYIMDEPTIGLHPKDTTGIINILKGLRDLGNTVIVIEHDIDVMQAADYVVDIGPGSGKYGGEIIGKGTLEELKGQDTSITGSYLKGKIQNR